jgi:threonine dehydrogenase-like Zn-dependent dehydrogenase
MPWLEDYDLWLTALNAGANFAKLPERLVRVRDAHDRTSRTDPRCTLAALMACKIHHLTRDVLADRKEVLVWGAGRVGKRWLRALPAAGIRVCAAVELHPRRLGKRIHGALIIPPEDLPGTMSDMEDPFILVAVGAPGVRDDIRDRAGALGLSEGTHYLFVA